MATMRPDPFYRRSGFWAAVGATIPIVYAAIDGAVPMTLTIAVVSAWAGFFTAQRARPSNSNQVVLERMAEQAQLIRQLRSGMGRSGE